MFHLDFSHVDALESSHIDYLVHILHGMVNKQTEYQKNLCKRSLIFFIPALTLGKAQIFSSPFGRVILQTRGVGGEETCPVRAEFCFVFYLALVSAPSGLPDTYKALNKINTS